MTKIALTVTSNAAGYWLAVDAHDVRLKSGRAVLDLERGNHSITWWLVGNEGSSINIEGKDGTKLVLQVKESKIPTGETMAGGFKRFEV